MLRLADLSDIEETEGEAVVLLVLGQVGEELLDHGHGLLLAVRHEAGHTLGNVDWPGLVNVASPGCTGWASRSEWPRPETPPRHRLKELQHGG